MNVYAERLGRSIKEECHFKLISIGPRMSRLPLRECAKHCHLERNHRGFGYRMIVPLARYARRLGLPSRSARRKRIAVSFRIDCAHSSHAFCSSDFELATNVTAHFA